MEAMATGATVYAAAIAIGVASALTAAPADDQVCVEIGGRRRTVPQTPCAPSPRSTDGPTSSTSHGRGGREEACHGDDHH